MQGALGERVRAFLQKPEPIDGIPAREEELIDNAETDR